MTNFKISLSPFHVLAQDILMTSRSQFQ